MGKPSTKPVIEYARKREDFNITKNFKLSEFLRTSNRNFFEKNQMITDEILENITKTAELLQKVRDQFGAIRINSGYRCPELNRAIGSRTNTSQHLRGLAVDFVPLEANIMVVYEWILNNKDLEFSQVILERRNSKNFTWIHLGVPEEFLTAQGKYKQGLVYDGARYHTWERWSRVK
jgi:hypothetical protein